MNREKVAVAQVGGPTAVMNQSLFGFLEEATGDHEVYGVLDGLQGLAEDRMVVLDAGAVRRHRGAGSSPGAWLGSGRWRAETGGYVRTLEKRGIRRLALIGGNGTMWACREIEARAKEGGLDLAVVGIPKTVDNDLAATDHAPGFGSAARYVAAMVRDVGRDLWAMRNFEAVRVLETMGRNVGWLAASAGYLKREAADPPHLVYVPERRPSTDGFLAAVEDAYGEHGHVVVVVSEGLTPSAEDPWNRPLVGGVSRRMAAEVEENLGLPSRGELLGMGQRCSSLAVSPTDAAEARAVGREAARVLRGDGGGCMISLERADAAGYEWRTGTVPLEDVAGVERPLPERWIPAPNASEDFNDWLGPLLGGGLERHPAPATEVLS